MNHVHDGLNRRRTLKGWLASQRGKENRAQRINIRRRGMFLEISFGLFRRHIARSSERRSAAGQAIVAAHQLGQSEVRDDNSIIFVDQNVGRLEISMQNSLRMSISNRPRDITDTSRRLAPGIGWFDTDYLGIDQGPIIAMIENYRSDLIWKTMRKNPYIVAGLKKAGFTGGWLGN